MTWWKRLLIGAAAMLVVGVGAGEAVPKASRNVETYFGPHANHRLTIDNHFISLLDSAKKTIDGAFFELRLDSIADAFLRAHERGVKIRLVTDSDYVGNEWMQKLIEAGIEVVEDDRSALMHNKFAIVDGTTVWTGSYNLTDSCSWRNNNNAMCIRSPELAKVYQREFNEMYEDGQFGVTSPSTIDQQSVTLRIGNQNANIQVFFAPEDKPNLRIAELLKKARKQILFMHFAFTADQISDVLIEKFRSGVDVTGIFDSRLYRSTGPYSEFFKLTNADVPIILADNREGKLHHKVFIVDPGEPDGFVISGSLNSSNNGDGTNDENVIVIHNQEIAQSFYQEFKKLRGTFSQCSATTVNFFLKPETKVPSFNVVFNANGRPVERIEVMYPARWKLGGEEKVSIYRLDQRPLPKGSVTFHPKGFTIENASLTPFGKSSYLVFNFKNLVTPKIQGGYNLYVRAGAKVKGKMTPLQNQPGIQVTEKIGTTESAVCFETLLQKMRLAFSELLKMQGSGMNDKDFEKMFAGWREHYDEITEVILNDARNGEYTKLDQFFTLYYQLPVEDRKRLEGFMRNIKTVLKVNAAHGDEAATERVELLKRNEK